MRRKNESIELELKNLNAQIGYISNADILLMKDKIIHTCKYYLSKREIPLTVRDNLMEMYQCYQNMGGNGVGKILFDQAMTLPVTELVPSESNQQNFEESEYYDRKSSTTNSTTKRKSSKRKTTDPKDKGSV